MKAGEAWSMKCEESRGDESGAKERRGEDGKREKKKSKENKTQK